MVKNNKISNNKYFDCPAIMNDGRAFTDYRQNCILENSIQFDNKIGNSYEYKQFLINNGLKIMDINKENSFMNNGFKKRNVDVPGFKNICEMNSHNVSCELNDMNGIGTYYNSKLINGVESNIKPFDPLFDSNNQGYIIKPSK